MTTVEREQRMATPQAPAADRSPVALFALIVGIVYLLVGLIGFAVTGFGNTWVHDTNDELLGFALNGFHNFVHIGIGIILIGASMAPAAGITQGILIGGGATLLLAAFLGFTGQLDHLLSIESKSDPDNFLHLATGALAVLAGLFLPGSEQSSYGGPGAGAMGTQQSMPPAMAQQGGPSQPQRRW